MKPTAVMITAGLATAALLLLGRRKSAVPGPGPTPVATGPVMTAIVAESKRQGVNPAVALLFADLETSFKNVRGDKTWPDRRRADGRTNWEALVRDSSTLAVNPFRFQRQLWVSYGPFQLLSPYEIARYNPKADPRILDNVPLNVRLGVAKIKRLTDKYGDDLDALRLAYTCGSPGGCLGRAPKVLARMATKADKYGLA